MAPPVEPPSTITLRIKVPPGHIEGAADEFTLGTEVPVNATIGQVRERIQRTVPSHPAPERQRLLYAGRALIDNEQTLADALNIKRDPTQAEYVVHLLVKGDGTATAPVPSRRGVSTPGRESPAQAGLHLPATGDTTQQAGDVPGLQQAQPHVHHDHPHQQHIQQHQAALAAQQQQLFHNLNQPPPAAGQGQPPVHFGLQQIHLGAGFPMLPLGPQFGPAMLPQQAQIRAQQPPVVQAEGARESHPARSTDTAGQPDGQPRSASQPPPPRPHGHGVVLEGRGPNGERFHFQQHVQLGQQGMLPAVFGLQQPAQQPAAPRRPGPSALEQARDNIAEMRRMLSELRGLDAATDEQRDRIDRIQQRTQEVNNYIDPFNLGGSNGQGNTPLQHTRTTYAAQAVPIARPASQPPRLLGLPSVPPQTHQAPAAATSRPSTNVTCYLLSSPTGPQAILYSPQHGTYTSRTSQAAQTGTDLHATPTTRQPEGAVAQAPAVANVQPPVHRAQAVAAQPGAAPVQQDGFGAIGPGLINHIWLLMRVLIFAYFILGANLGWRRPLALLAIGLGFWLLRQGPLGEGGILRRWWDGIVNHNQRLQPVQQNGQEPAQGQAADARPGHMPTPAQVAQRLLDEDRQQRNHRLSWLREQIRPVERAVALLIASLWPGVGEAYVRALEAEERRRNEEEVATRRREEEERQRREEEEQRKVEDAAAPSGDDKIQVDSPAAGVSADSTASCESREQSS